jgi:hypothetical protein
LSGAEALVALAGRPLILLARSDVKGNVKLLRVIANDNDAVAALVKPYLKKLSAAEA